MVILDTIVNPVFQSCRLEDAIPRTTKHFRGNNLHRLIAVNDVNNVSPDGVV